MKKQPLLKSKTFKNAKSNNKTRNQKCIIAKSIFTLSKRKKNKLPKKEPKKKQYINQIIHTPKIKSQKKKFNILCGKFRKLIVGLKKIYILEILSKSVFIFL